MFKKYKEIIYKPLRILDIFISLWLIGITVFLICYWKHIPEEVPYHWNAAGQIDDYSDKGGYIMLIIMMYFLWAWHALSKLIPLFGIKENLFGKNRIIVPRNVEIRAYNLIFAMLWICDLLMQFMLGYIILCGVFVKKLGVWFLPVCIILFIADFIWFYVELSRLKKRVL